MFAESLLDRCEHSARNVNLDYHSAALIFNCLDEALSVLRNVLDQSEDLSCRDSFLELCSCFSEIQFVHEFWGEKMTEIGRRTTNPHRIRLWCPSICHNEFGQGTLYTLLVITVAHQRALFSGSTRLIFFLYLSSFY